MTKTDESLTYQEALSKYFGDVLNPKVYPIPCKCGTFWLLHLDDSWIVHLREYHDERVVSPEQRARTLAKRKEKEANKPQEKDYSVIFGRVK